MRALAGDTSTVDDIEIPVGDRVVPLSIWAAPIRGENGSVEYAIAAFQDISARRRAEAEQAKLQTELRQSQKMESIGRLAGGIAHDFNNLLVPIMGYANMARAYQDKPELEAMLEAIWRAGDRAADLIQQLLAFGRRQVLEMRPLDLNAEIRVFERVLRRLVRENIGMELKLAPPAPGGTGVFLGDRTQLQQIVMNLVVNASDAMPDGGTLTIETGSVRVEGGEGRPQPEAEPGPYLELVVRDTGQGMDPETQKRIFEPFFTTKGPGKGTGLGLSTAYGIVHQHRGHISVSSEPGRGTSFRVLLPEVAEEVAPAAPEEPTPAPVSKSSTILLCEDDEHVRHLVETALSARGHKLLTAATPDQALELAARHAAELDLLVTDVIMPGMNGYQLYERVAAQRPGLRVVFMSGHTDQVAVPPDQPQPGVDFLQKPFALKALYRAVERPE